MGNLEALGDAVTGGVVGRAVEPAAGEGADGHTHETHCLNCRTELVGDYCHACGQHAHVHRTLTAFFHDFLHGVFHLEGKIWRTLPLLAWKPGELTRAYIDGQRARFVSPIALFLFSVFLMFAAVGLTGGFDGPTGPALNAQVSKTLDDTRAKIAALETDRAEAVKQGRPTSKIDARLADARAKIAELESSRVKVIDGGAIKAGTDAGDVDMPFWVRGMMNKANGNPQLLAYKIKSNAYKFSWALIPISVAFVWLLFPFSRKYRLYDHTVFVTYSLSFMTLLFALYVLLSAVGLEFLAAIASLVPPVHMYRQLRGTYALSVKSALWRTALLVIFAFVAVTLFSALLVGLGLFD
jgi:hypothetical protein